MKTEKDGISFPPLAEAYRNALDYFGRGRVYFNEQGAIINANEVAHQKLGYAEGALLSKSIIDINPYISLLAWRRSWAALQKNGTHSERTKFLHTDGGLLPVSFFMAMADQDGIPCAVLVFEALSLDDKLQSMRKQ